MKGGLNKGSPYEREISRELSLYFSKGESGKKDRYMLGDITFIDPQGKPYIDTFLVELKRGRKSELDVLSIVDFPKSSKEPSLIKWWKKAETERIEGERAYSQIIIRRDRKVSIIVLDTGLFEILSLQYRMRIVSHDVDIAICPLDDFKSSVDPSIYPLERRIS